MVIATTAIILAIIGFIFYTKQKSGSKEPLSRQDQLIEKNLETLRNIQDVEKYWGLYIDYENESLCCQQAFKLNKKPITKKLAPTLPLKGCDKSLCRCRFIGLPEKRRDTRREQFDRRDEIRFEDDNDRRLGAERRSGMWNHHDE